MNPSYLEQLMGFPIQWLPRSTQDLEMLLSHKSQNGLDNESSKQQ